MVPDVCFVRVVKCDYDEDEKKRPEQHVHNRKCAVINTVVKQEEVSPFYYSAPLRAAHDIDAKN